MKLTEELKLKTFDAVAKYVKVAKDTYGIDIPMPVVYFDLKGGDAGVASPAKNIIRINSVLLQENEKDFMSDTIPHEVAHIVCYLVHGWIRTSRGFSHHGVEWKAIMRAFGCEPTRCHSMDVSRTQRKMRKFSYQCPDCLVCMPMSDICHNRVLKGKSYTHNSCKTPLQFIEEIK